jgi:hypothetical protein
MLKNNINYIILLFLGLITVLYYFILSDYIDLHPDEAVYYSLVSPSRYKNIRMWENKIFYQQTGIFYNFIYSFFNSSQNTRLVSSLLGGCIFICTSDVLGFLGPV